MGGGGGVSDVSETFLVDFLNNEWPLNDHFHRGSYISNVNMIHL